MSICRLLVVLVLTGSPAAAQDSTESAAPVSKAPSRSYWFQDRSHFPLLRAEPRGDQVKATVLGLIGPYQYAQTPSYEWAPSGSRLGMDLSIGREIPVYTRDTGLTGEPLGPDDWGFEFVFPVSFHMLWDITDTSNPIINNDYRFGLIGRFTRGVSLPSALRRSGARDALGLKLQVGHESSHLGDEITVAAVARGDSTFERMNPSFEFVDAAIGFMRHRDILDLPAPGDTGPPRTASSRWSIRAGAVHRVSILSKDQSFYTADPLSVTRPVAFSHQRTEPYVQFEAEGPSRLMPWRNGWASVDLRRKIVYDYRKASDDTPEDTQWSVNALLGTRVRAQGHLVTPDVSLYLRGYYGVNPHGQFRSDPDFWMVGLGILIDR